MWEEELLAECRMLLSNVLLQVNVSDHWQWLSDVVEGYLVCFAYQLLTSHDPPILGSSEKLIWHSQVPLKMYVLAWRLLRDRLPTKNNLLSRDIISSANSFCLAGCDQVEIVQHLFLHCNLSSSLWQQVRFWIGVSGIDHQSIWAHLVQFTNYLGGLKERRSFLQLLWLLCIWLVWNDRNNRMYNNSHSSTIELMEKVKSHSYWWLRANNVTFVHGSQQWWSSPLTCLGIG